MITAAARARQKKGELASMTKPVPADRAGSFATFYEAELAGQVRRATLLVGDSNDARDVVHDAFIEVYRRWGELDGPGAYLTIVVLNRCRDRARRVARQSRAAVQTSAVTGDDFDGEALWT